MNTDLKHAIESYCSMLAYPNSSAQPNDDRRLYGISYFLVKTREALDEDFFKIELRKNTRAGFDNLNDTQFNEFVESRISEINNGKYVIDSISHLAK